jgi:predicted Zn-ribbon and HTH transcriptional regulator
MSADPNLLLPIEQVNSLIDRAIYSDYHNIVVVWGELGKGKTTMMMWMLYRVLKDWKKVLSFELEPHTCLSCGHEWNAGQPYLFEVTCPKCNVETKTSEISEAMKAVLGERQVHRDEEGKITSEWVRKPQLVIPFPYDLKTGLPKQFPAGTVFSLNTGKARGIISQKYPYMNYSFHEFRGNLENAVETRVKLPIMGWDDIAVYFHRSNIQYMHPDVKNFFSRYNFIRKYCGNVVITVPTPNFVPEQLMVFCTGDILVSQRGMGDFDIKKEMRAFRSKTKTWTKSYDGRDVSWKQVPEEWFNAYEEIRHAHAVEAFEHPEEIFVTSMPKAGKEFTENESLL